MDPLITDEPSELSADALQHRCDPASLGFDTTDELPDLQDVIGQPRALRALELGSEVTGIGYNIFVLGSPGSGRTTLSQEYLQRKAVNEPLPDDWCYVYNFDNPHAPHALHLPAGKGAALRKDMQDLVSYCEREIPKAFESPEYIQDRDRILNEMKKNQEESFEKLQDHVGKFNFILMRTSAGMVLTPTIQGRPLEPKDIEQLSPEQRQKFQELVLKLSADVEQTLNRLREMGRTTDQKMEELNRKMTLFIIEPLIRNLIKKFHPNPTPSSPGEELGGDGALPSATPGSEAGGEGILLPPPPESEAGAEGALHPSPPGRGAGGEGLIPSPIIAYLQAVQADISANAARFKVDESTEQALHQSGGPWTQRYTVNLLIDNSTGRGAPVILESQPTYPHLLGRIEHEMVMGIARTDFTMIRPGALHRANGGYLILPARDLLTNPYAWEALKRVLRDGVIRIVELSNQMGLVSTQTLEPEPIPLQIKVLLIGTPLLYHLLRMHDEDFGKLFKVQAEFATLMDRTSDTEHEYGLFIKSVLDDNLLPPFDRTAVARVIEYSSRLAEHQHKLTTRFGKISDLVRESAYWANKEKQEIVTATAVQRAINEGNYRNNLSEERLQELMAQDILMIDAQGAVTGQINALSVLSLGEYAFGRPCRVTASVHPGQGGIVDIERQAKLGGPIHTKGVLILSGFLGGHYGSTRRLNLAASLTFEQSYDEIEGDSASAAELLTLLSAIAEVPLRQDRAITGSINQRGQIQAIGGVNEKIEGFFAICKAKGLTGEQGVLIPAANRQNLMLRAEVISAVAEGQFHIYPVSTLDACLLLLTGLEAGAIQPDGTYPETSFNARVIARLEAFSRIGDSKNQEKEDEAEEK